MTITITNMRPEHIPQLVIHQGICFATMDPAEWITAEQFAEQLRIFPEGQHVALDGARVVGQSSTFRCLGELAFAPHTYHDITAGNYFSNHHPEGEWLYGGDMSVHPEYRGRRIASLLYDARKALIRQLGLRGMVAGGAMPGYANYRYMEVEEYVATVAAGQIFDPTLTAQLRNGYTVSGILRGYVDAGPAGHDATLIVWEA
jgi:GNAT superfamily N-acetyltransferase